VQQNRLSASQIGLICAIAACPVLMAIVPWDFGPDMTRSRYIVRSFSLTPTLIQLIVICIGMQNGLSIASAWRGLPQITQFALPLLAALCMIPWFMGAEDPGRIPMAIIVFLVHIIFTLFLFELLSRFSEAQRAFLAKCIASGVAAYCAVWAVSLFFYLPKDEGWVVLVPGVTNVRGLGFFVVAGFFMALAALPEDKATSFFSKDHVLPFLLAFIACLLGFWTGSRGSIFAIVVALGLLILFAPRYWKPILLFGGLALALAALVSLFLPIPNPSYGIIRFAPPAGEGADVSSGRVAMWLEAIPKILERPIFGWGLDQFQLIQFASFRGYRQPHNVVLQSLISTGFIGSALLAVAVLPVVRRARLQTGSLVRISALGMIATICIFAMYDAALYYNYPLMMLAVAAALAFAPVRPQPARDRSG